MKNEQFRINHNKEKERKKRIKKKKKKNISLSLSLKKKGSNSVWMGGETKGYFSNHEFLINIRLEDLINFSTFSPWTLGQSCKACPKAQKPGKASAFRMLMEKSHLERSEQVHRETSPPTPPHIFKTLLAGLLCCCALECDCPRRRNEEQTPSVCKLS